MSTNLKRVIVEDRSLSTFQFEGWYNSEIVKIIKEVGEYKIAYSSKEWKEGDVIIINYPEKFSQKAKNTLDSLIEEGKSVILTGYYRDEDDVTKVINKFTRDYGIFLHNSVEDEKNCAKKSGKKDKHLIVTSKVYAFNKGVKKLLFPYPALIESNGEAKIFVESGKGEGIAAYYQDKESKGILVVIGTTGFWDDQCLLGNYGKHYDNRKFVKNLLSKNF